MEASHIDSNVLALEIDAIVEILNGIDISKEIPPDFGLLPTNPSNKYAGPTDMQDLRYLILLYASKYIDNFTTWREKFGSYTYISPTKLEKVANARIFHTKILFRRAGAIKDIYLRWSKGHFVMIKEGKFVAITERGEELCRNVITTMILSLPSKRKQQLTENIQTLNQSRPFRGQTKYGVSELRDKAENYGLNMLSDDYKLYRGSENDFENWKNGFSFELSSIRMKQELRRDKVIEDITKKLDNEGKILIVGETGTSKSTILMEIMWDFLEAGFYVLYNFGTANIRHADGLVNFIKDLLQDGIKVLVAVDNAHEERISPIFYVTDKLFSSQLTGNLKLILTARLPEFDLFVKDRLYKVSEGIRKSIIRLTCDPNFKYPLPYFTKEEIKEFIRLYSDITDKDQSDKKCQEIYDYTMGYPIMVKFSLFSQGLSHDVRERHDRYLKSPLQMKAMLICSLLDIASLKITNFILEKCRVLKGAYYIQGATLYQSAEGTWKTIHARWDEEFLSMLYNEENKAILLDRIECLQDAINSIFDFGDETITESVIGTLYNLCTEGTIPIDIVDKVVKIPEYLSKDRKRDLYGLGIGPTYVELRKYDEAVAIYDKALALDPCHTSTVYNKGVALQELERYEEAMRCYDKVLEIEPKHAEAWNNKGAALHRLGSPPLAPSSNVGKYIEALKCFDAALKINAKNMVYWINKGIVLQGLEKHEGAIKCYNRALELDPKNVQALHSKGISLDKLGRHDGAIPWNNLP